jgi:hypothetical protein
MELPTGDAWGCTSILIIELANGKCSIANDVLDRQNELFENLVWEGVEEIKATILITKEEDEEDDDYSISTLALEKKIEIKPCSNLPKGKKLLKDKAENALKWWVNCEGQTSISGETPFFEELASDYKVNSFDLTINTKKKVMEIKAGKKKINIKLSGIKTKKFNIDI